MSGRRSPWAFERRVGLAVAARPRLWWPALTMVARMAPRGWWRRWPPLPSPSAAYAEFRVHTALGGPVAPGSPPERALDAAEVVAFLEWCRRMAMLSKARRRGG